MIVLITGASHTGKTLLAQRLLEQYHYPYLSIDHLKMGLIRSGNTDLTPADDAALTAYLWPIVREMVKTAIENGQDLTVEGCYIPAGWRRDFDERYLPSIRFVCLAMTDAYIDAHFAEIQAHASDIEARLDDTGLTAQSLKADNHAYIEGCRSSGERVVWIDSDYAQTIAAFLKEERMAPMLAYCGVDCAACADYLDKRCPSCRWTDWRDDPCMPVRCCREKGIECCAFCGVVPFESSAEVYAESEGHRAAFRRMRALRGE